MDDKDSDQDMSSSKSSENESENGMKYSISPAEPDRMIALKHMNSRSRSKYRMLSTKDKEAALQMAVEHPQGLQAGLKYASMKYNAPIKSLKRWMKVGYLRKKGGGRKTKDPQMESKLNTWYQECRKSGVKVTSKMVKDKAMQLSKCSDFIASKGWLDKFKVRFGLEIEKTPKGRKAKSNQSQDDEDCEEDD